MKIIFWVILSRQAKDPVDFMGSFASLRMSCRRNKKFADNSNKLRNNLQDVPILIVEGDDDTKTGGAVRLNRFFIEVEGA